MRRNSDETARSDLPPAAGRPPPSNERERTLAGLANVAAMAFLAARAVPGGFVVALAGGIPLARAAERHGARAGYAAAGASLIETMAVMGPARMGIPVPHAASAPALGALERRGAALLTLAVVGATIRFAYYVVTSAFYVLVLVGLEAYTGTYEALRETFAFLPAGDRAALFVTAAFLGVWSLGAGLIQAWALRRGLRHWPEAGVELEDRETAAIDRPGLADPQAVVGTGIVAIAITLATTEPVVLALVAGWLVSVWLIVRASARSLAGGLALAAPLAVSTLAFGLVGGLGGELSLRRAGRVALLVLIAVWLRSAAGADGLRAISLRAVRRLRRLSTLALAAHVLGASAGVGSYGDSARRLGRRMRSARKRPVPLLSAALGWIADEAAGLPRASGREEGAARRRSATALIVATASLGVLVSAALVVSLTA